MPDRMTDDKIAQFCSITGASAKDAKKLLDKYKQLEVAIDKYYTDDVHSGKARGGASSGVPSLSKLNTLFDKYKDKDDADIAVDGTIKLCSDLAVDPEDVVLLAVAYELKSPSVGRWTRTGWLEGWKRLKCDNIPAMQDALGRLRKRLESDPTYFGDVYRYTFAFAKQEGQRSISLETALAFWNLLLPHGMKGGALAKRLSSSDSSDDVDMVGVGGDAGWNEDYTQWWFEFLTDKGARGVSKDVWEMFLEFVRSIDSKFQNYDEEGAWPSTVDDFVEYARKRLGPV
ncbi:defective in Cullin neddylation protein 1 [Amanita muscaria]